MSLPDLDTSSIGFIGFNNVVDSDSNIDSIDPSSVTDLFETVREYSNGVEGVYLAELWGTLDPRKVRVRVKEDGWIIAWFEREENYDNLSNDSTLFGSHDFINDWTDTGVGWSKSLDDIIQTFSDNLSQSISYDSSTTGYYHYEHPSASTYTVMAGHQGNDGWKEVSIEPLETTLYYHAAISGRGQTYGGDSQVHWRPNGYTDIQLSDGSDSSYGSVQAKDETDNGVTSVMDIYNPDGNYLGIPSYNLFIWE